MECLFASLDMTVIDISDTEMDKKIREIMFPSGITICEYFCQGEDLHETYCDICGDPLSEYDRGYGTVLYSVGLPSVQWCVGDGSIVCPGCVGDDAKRAVRPLEYEE